MEGVGGQYGFDPIFQEDSKEEEKLAKIAKNHITEEPIFEVTEENISEKMMTEGKSQTMIQRILNETEFNKSLPLSTDDLKYQTQFSATSYNPRGRKLLIITIDIGKGRNEQLAIHENDNPQEVAEKFCERHQYESGLKDMLQYQIEGTIYEAKSKLLKKERSQGTASQHDEAELEIPLEFTYSEGGIRISPKGEFSTVPAATNSQNLDRNEVEDQNSEFFSNNIQEGEPRKESQEYEIEAEGEEEEGEHPEEEIIEELEDNPENGINEVSEEYQDYSGNIPESGKKYNEVENTGNMRLNIKTNTPMKPHTIRGVAQKYLDMKSKFIPDINETTNKIGTFRVGTEDLVYNRLATDAKQKIITSKKTQKPVEKKPKMSKALHKDYTPVNFGERLYQKSRINKERNSRLSKLEQNKKKKEEEKSYPFKPEINEVSHKYYKRSYKVVIADSLLEEQYKTEADYARARDVKEVTFYEEHTFNPTISMISQEIMKNKIHDRPASVHEQLAMKTPSKFRHLEKTMEKKKGNKTKDKPQRKSTYKSNYKGRSIDEMVYSKQHTERENKQKREEDNSFSFKPVISRGPKNQTNEEIPLHDRLILEGTRLNQERNKRKEENLRQKKLVNIKTTSVEILEKKKRYILMNVFEVLDGNNDGFISNENCDFDKLNQELKEFFEPLIEEIKESNVSLSKEDFIECSLQLYKKLNPTQRSALINAGRVKDRIPREEEYAFTPYVSQRSSELAVSIRPEGDTVEDRLLSGGYAKKIEPNHFIEEEY
ncbi:unnamed protein product [Moneuplotes crassus]|uniref:EF-hand domain-containing protein n=1 Tax=Euplotes crassus TaxID=5936 RepID=A0AAD1Y7F5_EUPCR|nr:unnamed protein product [Moneuplotes crassus]